MRDYNYTGDPVSRWEQETIGPSDAIMGNFFRYSTSDGRSSRSEFVWWVLFLMVIFFGIDFLGRLLEMRLLVFVFAALLAVPTVCIMIRRLHDIGKSGWWLFTIPTGIGAIIILLWCLCPSEPYRNDYGQVPNMVRCEE